MKTAIYYHILHCRSQQYTVMQCLNGCPAMTNVTISHSYSPQCVQKAIVNPI